MGTPSYSRAFRSLLVQAHLAVALIVGASGTMRAAAPEPVSTAAARALHERLLVLDSHLDTPASLRTPGWSILEKHSLAEDFTQVDYPRMVEGGLDGGFWAVFTPQGPRTPEGHAAARDAALLTATRIREMVAKYGAQFSLALRSDDAARIAGEGKRVVFMSIENGYPLGHDLTLLKTFYQLGVRMVGPVHFNNNELGDSASDPKGKEWSGLSPLGKQLVTEANRLGMVLDASHASDAVLDQMLELSTAPIILSHSGCRAVFNHPRNVTDEALRRLAAKDGVIQINAYSTYVANIPLTAERNAARQKLFARFGGRNALSTPDKQAEFLKARRELEAQYPGLWAPFDAFFAHLLHALKIVGPEHVGISGDFDGGGGVEGFNDATCYPTITERLLREGYTEADLEKIWSGNVLRVLKAAEANAEKSLPAPESK